MQLLHGLEIEFYKMSINVYWACLEDQWMLAEQPQPILPSFYQKYDFDNLETQSLISQCPFFNNSLKNTYAIKSIYNYEFSVDVINNNVYSPLYDQDFFNSHVLIRSIKNKFFSFEHRFIFFTDENSLETSFYEYPFFENNNITKSCVPTPGVIDIGKWFRLIEFPFFLKENIDTFKVEKGETMYYIKFNTNEKINFKQFRYSEKLDKYKNDGFILNKFSKIKSVENYYKLFKNKKLILEEIHKNLI